MWRRRPERGRRRASGVRAQAGMTLVELVVAMSLLAVVSVMGAMVMFGTRRVADQVTWRANASSDIRDLLDRTFADLSSARPPAACIDESCARITESRSTPDDPTSPPPSVLVSASGTSVCYLSQRRDAIGAVDAAAVLQPYWKICLAARVPPSTSGLAASERLLVVLAYAPTATDASYGRLDSDAGFASSPTSTRQLGVIDVRAAPPFSFSDNDGADVAGRDLDGLTWRDAGGLLTRIAKVEMRIRLSAFDRQGRPTNTRTLTFTAALRTSRYEQERNWSGDRAAAVAP